MERSKDVQVCSEIRHSTRRVVDERLLPGEDVLCVAHDTSYLVFFEGECESNTSGEHVGSPDAESVLEKGKFALQDPYSDAAETEEPHASIGSTETVLTQAVPCGESTDLQGNFADDSVIGSRVSSESDDEAYETAESEEGEDAGVGDPGDDSAVAENAVEPAKHPSSTSYKGARPGNGNLDKASISAKESPVSAFEDGSGGKDESEKVAAKVVNGRRSSLQPVEVDSGGDGHPCGKSTFAGDTGNEGEDAPHAYHLMRQLETAGLMLLKNNQFASLQSDDDGEETSGQPAFTSSLSRGLFRGASLVGRSLLRGASELVDNTMEGRKQGGWMNLAKGVGLGAFSLASHAMHGAVSGVGHISAAVGEYWVGGGNHFAVRGCLYVTNFRVFWVAYSASDCACPTQRSSELTPSQFARPCSISSSLNGVVPATHAGGEMERRAVFEDLPLNNIAKIEPTSLAAHILRIEGKCTMRMSLAFSGEAECSRVTAVVNELYDSPAASAPTEPKAQAAGSEEKSTENGHTRALAEGAAEKEELAVQKKERAQGLEGTSCVVEPLMGHGDRGDKFFYSKMKGSMQTVASPGTPEANETDFDMLKRLSIGDKRQPSQFKHSTVSLVGGSVFNAENNESSREPGTESQQICDSVQQVQVNEPFIGEVDSHNASPSHTPEKCDVCPSPTSENIMPHTSPSSATGDKAHCKYVFAHIYACSNKSKEVKNHLFDHVHEKREKSSQGVGEFRPSRRRPSLPEGSSLEKSCSKGPVEPFPTSSSTQSQVFSPASPISINASFPVLDIGVRELRRLGLHKTPWQIVDNSDYTLCPTYPRAFAVPEVMTLEELQSVANFRTSRRLPAVVWRHKNGATLSRCAQPWVGLRGNFCEEDAKLINALKAESSTIHVLDARSQIAATANFATGKGTEDVRRYSLASLRFCGIANIHSVRASYQALAQCLQPGRRKTGEAWKYEVSQTQWLSYASRILASVSLCVELLLSGESVLVHCSDGWDRTPQITSTVQILQDARYRTMEGFMVLIEKEWISFGHMFRTRLNQGVPPINQVEDDFCPIFVQWLDIIWQIWRLNAFAFEFNDNLLEYLYDQVFSGQFGTFLYDNERQRVGEEKQSPTESIWDAIFVDKARYINEAYHDFSATKKSDSSQSSSVDKREVSGLPPGTAGSPTTGRTSPCDTETNSLLPGPRAEDESRFMEPPDSSEAENPICVLESTGNCLDANGHDECADNSTVPFIPWLDSHLALWAAHEKRADPFFGLKTKFRPHRYSESRGS